VLSANREVNGGEVLAPRSVMDDVVVAKSGVDVKEAVKAGEEVKEAVKAGDAVKDEATAMEVVVEDDGSAVVVSPVPARPKKNWKDMYLAADARAEYLEKAVEKLQMRLVADSVVKVENRVIQYLMHVQAVSAALAYESYAHSEDATRALLVSVYIHPRSYPRHFCVCAEHRVDPQSR
jgi:hypothetical protein